MFGSNFDDFFKPGHNQPNKVENQVHMITFSTGSILTQFGVQFLSFPISTVEKCFGRILTTFPCLGTIKVGKVKIRARLIWFCTRNLPTLFGTQFLSFLISTTKKCFARILTTFPGPRSTGIGKVENRSQMARFSGQNILTLFEVQFLSLPIRTSTKCFGRILPTFSSPGTTGATKVENRVKMTMFGTWNILTQFVVQFLSFPVSTDEKCFGRNLTTFSCLGTIGVGKVKNWARLIWFCTRNLPTLFGTQFPSFPISTAEKCFARILTTFLGPRSTLAGKFENWS